MGVLEQFYGGAIGYEAILEKMIVKIFGNFVILHTGPYA